MADADEATALIALACGTTLNGQRYARELVEEQNMANLAAFSDRLERTHQVLQHNGNCRCATSRTPQGGNPL